jgi:hypothetical protein
MAENSSHNQGDIMLASMNGKSPDSVDSGAAITSAGANTNAAAWVPSKQVKLIHSTLAFVIIVVGLDMTIFTVTLPVR